MPLYEVEHTVPLSMAQQDELADALTTIHSTHFMTPRMFVMVRFIDTRAAATSSSSSSSSSSSATATYTGGKRRNINMVRAQVRAGPGRERAHFEALIRAVVAAWDAIVPMPKVRRGDPDLDFRLHRCVVVGGLVAGYEEGFMRPLAGAEWQWLREHWAEFNARADAGEETFRDLVEDVKGRKLLGEARSGDVAE